MNYKLLRLIALLTQTTFCLIVVFAGIVNKVPFFYTFAGPAAILIFIALFPNYYYDIVAVTTIILMIILSFIFAVAAAVFNHEYLIALAAPVIPLASLAVMLLCMERLKKSDESYT